MTRQRFVIRSFFVIPLFLCFLTCSQQQQQLLPVPVLVNDDVETTYGLFFFRTHTLLLSTQTHPRRLQKWSFQT
jgi:hypothetical protein